MNNSVSGLPEKSYFSVTEIAERWGRPIADVQHYLEQGVLRPAIKPTDLSGTIILVDFESAVDPAEKNRDNVCDPTIFRFLYAVHKQVESSLDERDVLPKMLDADDFTDAFDFSITMVEDIDGSRYKLVSKDDPDREVSFDISEQILCVERAGKFAWDWHPERAIISREERARFERKYGIRLAGDSVVAAPNYTTAYMDIMHQAIAAFFVPRHRRDPTKSTVKKWILERMAASGLVPSDQVAGVMFTIIKPSDHDPKKVRG